MIEVLKGIDCSESYRKHVLEINKQLNNLYLKYGNNKKIITQDLKCHLYEKLSDYDLVKDFRFTIKNICIETIKDNTVIEVKFKYRYEDYVYNFITNEINYYIAA